jgi:aryl-alcohol dehydrogenase-like predicted oxidoreductase
MRLSTDPSVDEARALAVLSAAIDAGATLLDTAPSYAIDEAHAHANEQLVASALAARPGVAVQVSTKVGLVRSGTDWLPDGRAKSIRASCEGSLRALGRDRLALVLLHTVDPKTPLATSARALAELQRSGVVERVGLCNVNVEQIEEASRFVEVAAVQVALSPHDNAAFLGGVVRHCADRGIQVFAHSPFGGPRRAKRMQASHGEVVAWLRSLGIVAVPGSTRVDHARAITAAARLPLDAARVEALSRACGALRPQRSGPARGEIVLLMGIQGAGKSTSVAAFESAGYGRLNRDARGGTMAALTEELERRAASGETRFVLDNLYLTRAARAPVVDVGARHDLDVRCIWLDTGVDDAQLNVVERLFARYDRVPDVAELRGLVKQDPQAFGPHTLATAQRTLEAPVEEEGFSRIERRPFVRATSDAPAAASGIVVELKSLAPTKRDLLAQALAGRSFAQALVIAWEPGRDETWLRTQLERAGFPPTFASASVAVCAHGAGPPTCWCRPPLPGLLVPWLHRSQIDRRASLLVGSQAVHERMAATLGLAFARV